MEIHPRLLLEPLPTSGDVAYVRFEAAVQILVLREIFFLSEAFLTNIAIKVLNFSMIRIDMSLDTVAVGVVLVAARLRALVSFPGVLLSR
jgi:hypothetical protein